jgi:hypothetical protein
MSLLSMVQDFCERTGVPSPTAVHGSTDDQVVQIRALLEEEGKDLAKRVAWERLTFETTHTTLANEDQGLIDSLTTRTFNYILNDTIWDRTNRWSVYGPLSPQKWQAEKARSMTGPRTRFRFREGRLMASPAPSAGWTWAWEYVTKDWVTDSSGATYRAVFGADSDVVLLPEDLMIQGLRWRWRKEKGLDYAEDFRTYEAQVKDAMGRDGAKPRLRMDQDSWRGPTPGIFVPSGNWMT